jgi:hypothetical protein
MLRKLVSCRAFSSISLLMSPACSSPSSTSTFDNEDWYLLANMLPGDLHSSLRCIGHSDPVATFLCGSIRPNKASKPIKCYLLPKVTIRFVRFRPLVTFNRPDITVHLFTFKSVSSRYIPSSVPSSVPTFRGTVLARLGWLLVW